VGVDRPLAADPDRLLPPEPSVRSIARELISLVEKAPIVSPHGHVDVRLIADDVPFADPASLLVTPDHYVTRLLHAGGVPMAQLRPVGGVTSRDIWRRFCEGWPAFAGTASGYWLAQELCHVLGVSEEPSAARADALYDQIQAVLQTPDFRPRKLFHQFRIDVLATTDDPLDDLSHHARLAADRGFTGRVTPTFRPDAYLSPSSPGWSGRVDRLLEAANVGEDYDGYLDALRARRAHFIAHGAVSADHGVRTPRTEKLDHRAAAALFAALRRESGRGETEAGWADRAALFEAHMLYEMARMSVDDGLVMTVHPGVFRDHHEPTLARFGPDTGHDIPVAIGFTEALRPLLADFGTETGFHLVLFTVDETVFSRELAPLASFYPSVYLGAPWWFLDAPYAMRRFREATVETAGYSRSSGFIDDTRGFCSIPARHDAARRVEAGVLARLVAERRISLARASEIIVDLIENAPRRVFKL
jgi:glucuronate isomerase